MKKPAAQLGYVALIFMWFQVLLDLVSTVTVH